MNEPTERFRVISHHQHITALKGEDSLTVHVPNPTAPPTVEPATEKPAVAAAEAPITLDELLNLHGFHLVTYDVRYGGPGVGVLIGYDIETMAKIADHMTGGDGEWWRASWLPGSVPWYPSGEADTFQEALDLALKKVNTLTREQWFEYACYEAGTIWKKYAEMCQTFDETKWPRLNPTPWLDENGEKFEEETE